MRIVGAGSDKKFHYATTEGPVGQATNHAHYQMASVQEATFNNANTDADYLVVAGSEPDFTKTTASNYGPTLGDDRQRPHIAASWCSNYNHAAGGIFCGTSQSAPVVSGLAVLIKEDDTTRTGKQIAAYLRGKADHANSGYDYGLGHGVAFLDGAALLEKYSGLPPAAIGINQTRTFRVLFADVDSSSGVKVAVGSNLSLNGNCTSGRLTQNTVDYGDEIDIKRCSVGDSTVQLKHATDNAVNYKSYPMTINQNTAFRCDRDRGMVANSSSLTWTNTWYSYCNAFGTGSSGISRYNSFSAPGSGYIKYKFVMPMGATDNLRLWHGSTPPRRMHLVLDEKRGVDTTSGVIERVLPSGQHFTLESNAASGTTGSQQVTVTSTSASAAPSLRVNVGDCTIAKDCIKVSWTPVDGINDYEIKWRESGSSIYLGPRILDAVDPATNSTRHFTLDSDDGIKCGTQYVLVVKARGDGVQYSPERSSRYAPAIGSSKSCSPTR